MVNKLQVRTETAVWGGRTGMGACLSRFTAGAHKFQSRRPSLRLGCLTSIAHPNSPAIDAFGRGFLLPRVGALQGCRAHLPQALRIETGTHKPTVDPLHRHSIRPFVESRSNDRNRDTLERPKSWKRQPRIAK